MKQIFTGKNYLTSLNASVQSPAHQRLHSGHKITLRNDFEGNPLLHRDHASAE